VDCVSFLIRAEVQPPENESKTARVKRIKTIPKPLAPREREYVKQNLSAELNQVECFVICVADLFCSLQPV
jgi:hypothetical protein